jgi:predicted Zn-dependent peptidase
MQTTNGVLLSLALLASLTVAATRATAQAQKPAKPLTQEEPFPLYRTTLPNGLGVWVQPRVDSPSVAALLVVKAGARYETQAKNGISHFLEHMLFTGTERWTESQVKEVIARRGGRYNGRTGLEHSYYYAHLPAEDVDVAIDWLAQIVFHPTISADKVDKERQVIFQERLGRYGWLINTLESLGFGYELDRSVRRSLFPGTGLALRVDGEDDSLEGLDRDALFEYYREYYTPENATLIVVGGVTPQEVEVSAAQRFGDLAPGGQPPAPKAPLPAAGGPHAVVVRGPWPTDQSTVMIGARSVGRIHSDRPVLDVLGAYLDTVLTEEIRDQQGLVYGLWAGNVAFDDAGYFVVSTRVEGKNREAIIDTIRTHLAQVQQGQVDASKVDEAKIALKGLWALDLENNLRRAEWLAKWPTVLDGSQAVPNYAATVEAVTPEDLSRVARTYFTPEGSYVGQHRPVLTVMSGARLAAVVLAMGTAALAGRRLWRRTKNR